MQRSQANRAVVARRVTQGGARPRRSTGPVSRNLLARPLTYSAAPGFTGTRRHGNRRPSADKGQDMWRTVSPSYREGRNPAWDATVSTV